MAVELSDEKMLRYNQQIVLRGFDFDGQEQLKAAHVLAVGLDGLGCATIRYLTTAGVGQLALLNFDTVSLPSLQCQTLHNDATIGQPRVDSAREALARINPYVRLASLNVLLDETALVGQVTDHDLVPDCIDNVVIRSQLNASCFQHTTPLVSRTMIRVEGQISVPTYQDGGPCYCCLSRLFGENALICVEAGIVVPLVGTIDSLQAMEAIKPPTGCGAPASGEIVMHDAMTCQFRETKLIRHPQCEVCGSH